MSLEILQNGQGNLKLQERKKSDDFVNLDMHVADILVKM